MDEINECMEEAPKGGGGFFGLGGMAGKKKAGKRAPKPRNRMESCVAGPPPPAEYRDIPAAKYCSSGVPTRVTKEVSKQLSKSDKAKPTIVKPPSQVGVTGQCVIRLPPLFYVHKLDINTNVTHVISGPQSFTLLDHEMISEGPEPMVTIPPNEYVLIKNPADISFSDNGEVTAQEDKQHQAILRYGDVEVRMAIPPFPLFPGEELLDGPMHLTVVDDNQALCLKAKADGKYFTKPSSTEDAFEDNFKAGEEWQFLGPGTYIPHGHVDVTQTLNAYVLRSNEALLMEARCDHDGRKTGEQWLVETEGLYLPKTYEIVKTIHSAIVLSETEAVRIEALKDFTDTFGVKRKIGDVYLITPDMTNAFIPRVEEKVLCVRPLISLAANQFCYIKNETGTVRMEMGEQTLFLPPKDTIIRSPTAGFVLQSDEALHLMANRDFVDVRKDPNTGSVISSTKRVAGSRWMLYGPTIFFVPVEVNIIDKYKAAIELFNYPLFFRRSDLKHNFHHKA
eukprot:TRINITY_DN41189_c0_g1_i1.p1 TRINITY_DN41189_c0_g1~~TRINITY_DN41189_c0_g1_i1.p1  ORF type:complete len:556 (+),score=141.41 TRINITY_DN41189_c0_g1_i1:149-1669(+)